MRLGERRIHHSLVALLVLFFLTPVFAAEPGAVLRSSKRAWRQEYALTTAQGIQVRLTFYRPDVFRIEAAPGGAFKDPRNDPAKAQIVVEDRQEGPAVRRKESKEQIEFTTERMTLVVRKKDCRFELLDAQRRRVWQELKPLQFDGTNTIQTLDTNADEFFYGGGQQNGYFSHKGTSIMIRADGNWNEGGHPNPAPFYLSNRGYGVLRNTFAVGAYDFTGNASITLSHEESRFDAYYFVGTTLPRIVDLYTQFTGRPNFVTIWALELGEADAWMTRDPKTKEPRKDEKGEFVEITPHVISRLAEQYRKHDMPGGWISPNDGYGCGYTQLEYVVKSLAALGFYTGLWTEKGLAKTQWEVGTAGTRVQKLDVAWTGPAYQFSLEANRQAWASLVGNSDTRGFVWTVQGWAGTHRYSVCWTGDQYGSWDLIRYHIPTLIGSGLSGQAYATTDIDGIFGGSPETYTRDLQWKCFTPVLYAMNGWAGKMSKSPWAYDEPYRSINRSYLKLKMRMTPYMYRYAREAYDTGAPIVRGLIWNFPQDRKTWDRSTQYEYMLGDWLLVAPVYTSMKVNKGWRKEDIYLPAGRWFDYWDGRTLDGPATIDAYPVTLEKLPLLVRGGAIIPMYPEMLYNNQKPKDPLTFDLYPYGASQFELYEDDGLTRKYQQGESARQLITMAAPTNGAGDIEVKVQAVTGFFSDMPLSRVYEFQVHSPLKPLAVELDGQPLLELTEPGAYAAAVSAWYYDPADRRGVVHVRLPRRSVFQDTALRLDLDEKQAVPASPPYPVPEVTPMLDKSLFLVTASSNQGGSDARNAFDGTPETMWHSRAGKDPDKYPHTIDVALGGLYPINGLEYLPRQIGTNGMIGDYELYVSRSTNDFGAPVARGRFDRSKDQQTNLFPAVWGEYVRIRMLNSVHSNDYASAAEFDLRQDLQAPPLPDEVVYLSDLKPARSAGTFRNDRSVSGQALTVNGQAYAKGLGVQSPSELVYALDGSWDRLSGHVGVDSEVGSKGSVMFRVFADGKRVFESPSMNGDNVKQLMDLSIEGVRELRLVLDDQGDGTDNDHGDWVEARLIRKGSAPH